MIALQNAAPIPIPMPYPTNENWYLQYQYIPVSSPPVPASRQLYTHSRSPSLTYSTPYPIITNSPPATPSKKKNTKPRGGKKQRKPIPQPLEFNMSMAMDFSDLSSDSSSPPQTPLSPFPMQTPSPRPSHARTPSSSSSSFLGFNHKYANSTFQNSPPPKALPKPRFLMDDDDDF